MDRVRFITHEGKQVLFSDLSGCSSNEMIRLIGRVKKLVTSEPRDSVLVLTDFTGAEFTKDALTRMKEVAVYDRPFVKRSAFFGADGLPKVFFDALKTFSQRDFHRFASRDEALAWLAKRWKIGRAHV